MLALSAARSFQIVVDVTDRGSDFLVGLELQSFCKPCASCIDVWLASVTPLLTTACCSAVFVRRLRQRLQVVEEIADVKVVRLLLLPGWPIRFWDLRLL